MFNDQSLVPANASTAIIYTRNAQDSSKVNAKARSYTAIHTLQWIDLLRVYYPKFDNGLISKLHLVAFSLSSFRWYIQIQLPIG